ncbi:MAG: hypothetical protein JO219_03410 [Candidatus Eremiobacteraeota bacterium]|nr:hypothetical protein [Candidatus Eremiobacteraeota bacterium]MBV8366006.1 hypothetical protein [Candidatus Eremiobacteraeota bacterium]
MKGTDPKTQLNQAMPDSYIKRIAQGQGLPPEFYASGIVPKNFCKPVNGVWTFPQGDQHFYNADEATVLAHNIPPNDRQTILTLANKIPAGERFYIKWMYTRDGLIVFSMKPENRGIFVGGGTPYFALNKGEIVNPDDGEVGPPPPRV